jgi:ariadne-1
MKKFLTTPLLAKLDQWILDQFVDSSKNVKWCPKPGCGQAVEYDGGDAIDVVCKCGTSFCFHCGNPAHSPAPCDLVKKWLTINDDGEAASERLIQSLTKPCPKCGTRIEKNRHCNHMKCSKCNFDFCWQCMQAISIGTTHPSWYVCKNREQAASEGKLDTAEEERLNLNKFLQKISMHKQHVEDCRKDRTNALALIPKIRDRESTLSDTGRTLSWLRTIAEKIAEAQRFLEWTWVYSYFMTDSSRKETFINWQKILEEKADGMLHDLEKALADKDSFPKFLNETKRITEIKKSVEVLTSKMQQMSELADEIASALQHEADTKTQTWSCLRCSKEFADKDKDGKRVIHCSSCAACRDHGDFDCLVLGCKKG